MARPGINNWLVVSFKSVKLLVYVSFSLLLANI